MSLRLGWVIQQDLFQNKTKVKTHESYLHVEVLASNHSLGKHREEACV